MLRDENDDETDEHEQEPHEESGQSMRTVNLRQAGHTPVPIHRHEPMADFSMMLRLGPNGNILKTKAGSEEQAGAVAYAQRLVELVGDLLGLDKFSAMECVFREGRCLVFAEPNGDTVALRPRENANIQPLRESLGL